MLAQDLPLCYMCHVCGICIATSESHAETRDDVLVFGRLHCSENSDRGVKTVTCPGCEQALGTRGDDVFFLRKDRVVMRTERLEILVCSLKQQEISELTPLLKEAFPHSNVSTRILVKAELRGFQLTGYKPAPDLVIVVHRSEGRVLLTDRNGFYHDVLGSAWQQTRGNVLVVLTRMESKADTELYDAQLLRSLATHGDQPTIGVISTLGRVLTWESSPSKPQLKQLQALMAKAYFREPALTVQGIPGQWVKQPQKAASSAWCALL
mmetsp:Transcript_109882/g.354769  ORF Transcript_109882/g.354769 Transcript_109882/m.354769 type:complete len:266 (+) Transcript_109882:210-1007(+)